MPAFAVLLTLTTTVTPALFAVIGTRSSFAWALNPAIQAGIMAIATQRAMLALFLGISGGYLIDNHSAESPHYAARGSRNRYGVGRSTDVRLRQVDQAGTDP